MQLLRVGSCLVRESLDVMDLWFDRWLHLGLVGGC